MDLTDTLVSGSWALYVLHPGMFTPGDLDLYISKCDRRVNMLMRFLESRHYVVESVADAYYIDYVDPVANDIHRILRLSQETRPHAPTINVVISRSASSIRPIFSFHSTIVMNFLAWYGLVCLYPRLSLARRGLINAPANGSRVSRWIKKYRLRGFDLQTSLTCWGDIVTHECRQTPDCPLTTRRVISQNVLFIPVENNRRLEEFIQDETWHLRVPCPLSDDH
ncbi:hypothetical protein BJ912DRAFT_854980 [Pholiota molesta]|nr:hypothetical protein BJ912DRAFT_854980 [Pholiota molesta]